MLTTSDVGIGSSVQVFFDDLQCMNKLAHSLGKDRCEIMEFLITINHSIVMNPTLSFYDDSIKISMDIDDLTMEKWTNNYHWPLLHCPHKLFREAQIMRRKEKCSSGPEQSTLITIDLSHEIHVEVPMCQVSTDVGDMSQSSGNLKLVFLHMCSAFLRCLFTSYKTLSKI